jgi:hypothetical protein
MFAMSRSLNRLSHDHRARMVRRHLRINLGHRPALLGYRA